MARRRRSLWLWVPLGAVALTAFAWLGWYGMARWELERTKDKLRQLGLPMTAGEVIPAPIPEDQNAAPLLKSAESVWQQIKDRHDFIKARVGSSAPELAPEKFDANRLAQLQAQMLWPELRELFRLMNEAAQRPNAVFDRDYSKGVAADATPLNPLFSAVQFLPTKAWLAAREGNQKEAAENLLTCSRLASFGLRDVFLIGWMIGASFDGIAASGGQEVIAELPPGSFRMKDWESLDDSWKKHAAEARGDLVRAIDGERVLLGTWIFERVMLRRISLSEQSAKVFNAMYPDQVRTLRWITNLYETALAPLLVSDYAAYLRLMVSVRERLASGQAGQPGHDDGFASAVSKWAVIARTAARTYDGTQKMLQEYEVKLQINRLGLALEDYRSREGEYPATLPDLGLPEAAITDPFTGQPFIYRVEGDNMLVYSVGFDREDGGGVPRGVDGRRDVVWRIERGSAAR
jgi:hypothetical protein